MLCPNCKTDKHITSFIEGNYIFTKCTKCGCITTSKRTTYSTIKREFKNFFKGMVVKFKWKIK